MRETFEVGVIAGTHGLKGEVKVFTASPERDRFESLSSVFMEADGKRVPLEIESVRYVKSQPLLKFKGYDRIEDVEKWRGRSLFIGREDAIPLEENEYYIGDLIGCRVFLENGTEFGEVTDISATGANDVYTIRLLSGKDLLIPAIDSCVLKVEPEKGRITIRLMDGLMDEK